MRKTSELHSVLLDTHIWLWIVAGSPQLSAATRDAVARALGRGRLRIAAISLWEIAMLASKDRIVLGKSAGLWLDEALAPPAPAIEPLTPRIGVESCELPAPFHADPADRMIVATARVTNATLLTRDQKILDYAERGHLTALAA